MFREMARPKQALTEEECIQLLKTLPRGVLAVLGDEDYPYALPMDHYYCEDDGKIYFHSGPKGHKVDAMARHNKVSFCLYDEGYRKEGEWSLNIRSVIVFGRVEKVEDQAWAMEVTRRLSYKYTDDTAYIEAEIANSGARTAVYAITVEHMSGKLVNEA